MKIKEEVIGALGGARVIGYGIAALAAFAGQAVFAADPEAELEAKLPAIFEASAAHYEKLMAASEAAQPKPIEAKNSTGMFSWFTGIFSEDEPATPAPRPRFPRNFDGGKLGTGDDTDWTSGFFPGSLWYLYEATGDEAWKTAAVKWTDRLEGIKDYVDNHDIGFMMYCSAGNGLRLTGDKKYEAWLHSAAKCLRERFNEKVGTIKSWNSWGENFGFFGMHHVTIIDNMMNLELLMWDSRFWDRIDGAWWSGQVALKHADTTLKHHFRADGSAYHIVDYDPETGKVHGIRAGQGACVEGTWARGQAWAVYGYTMMFRETNYARYLQQAIEAADYVMDAPTPDDGIPYWDYKAADIPNEPRDSSSAAILASSLLELSQYAPPAKAKRYRAWAVKALNSLAGDGYFSKPGECADFLIKHGTGVKPFGGEVDTPLNYGDYYFLEALLRFRELKRVERIAGEAAAKLPREIRLPKDELARRVGVRSAEQLRQALEEPIPEPTDELYGQFFTTGNRSNYQDVYYGFQGRLFALVEAEGKEGKGRYLVRIEEYLDKLLSLKSWLLPAHDWADDGKGNLRDTMRSVDLASSAVAADLACIVAMLDGKLKPETVARIKAECERRVFGPVRREIPTVLFGEARKLTAISYYNWWINCENNWNAVCWDNVVCAALGLLDDPLDRALFVTAANRAAERYLAEGFAADGYCSEGMGYWNYGYGHHLWMGRLLREVSNGKYDIFTREKQKLAAAYARAYTLRDGASPAFADGNGAYSSNLVAIVDAIWPDLPKALPAMSEFPAGQVWLFRDPDGLSVGIKGGHNNELHNHNDVGSYYLMDGDKFVTGDPGGEVYTRRTFSPQRYESQVLNSYGHPVPVIDGKLQGEGSNFCARVVEKKVKVGGQGQEWSVDALKQAKGDEVYEIVLDMTAAYDVKTLKKLTRTFVYDRKAKTFTVTDRVSFSEPTAFEDCYVTFGEKVNVEVKALKGGKVILKETTIDNPGKPTPHRFGYAFEKPVTEAEIEFKFVD